MVDKSSPLPSALDVLVVLPSLRLIASPSLVAMPTFTDRFNQTVANLGPVLAPQVFDNVAPGSSGLFANTSADSNAEGGDINVSTRDLFIRNELK
jgi:hypothetical protein